jgi:Rrf2 family iron-sulfur cluster assembly transcriptional regulator
MSSKSKSNRKLKLTTRGRYAVMAMVELAQRGETQPVPLADIANSGSISLSYLEQLFAGLRRNGLVKSYRGPGGGYILARPAGEILVSDILYSAEDCVPAKRTANDDAPAAYGNQPTHDLWVQIGEILFAAMQHISLEDVSQQKLGEHPVMNKLFETLT